MDQNWVSTFDVTMVTKAFQEKKSSMSQNSNYFKKLNSAPKLHNMLSEKYY